MALKERDKKMPKGEKLAVGCHNLVHISSICMVTIVKVFWNDHSVKPLPKAMCECPNVELEYPWRSVVENVL